MPLPKARPVPNAFALAVVAVAAVAGPGLSPRPAAGQHLPGDTLSPFSDSRVTFGSAALVSPGALLVNRGLSTLMFSDVEHRVGEVAWGRGWASVSDALSDPVGAIRRSGGWGPWLRNEFLPTGSDVWAWAWTANYGGHVIAGGITYRVMEDWFRARGTPHPRLAGAVYGWGLILVNEVVESQELARGASPTVADLYVFEPLGILLFSFDGVARFFGGTLQAADWSPQGSVTFPEGEVVNNSQVMSYKVPLPFTDRVRALLLVGQYSSSGVQVSVRDGYALGGAVGFVGSGRVVDPVTSFERLVPRWSGGLYLSRDNSLLVSGVMGGGRQPLAVNVYPGALPGRWGSLGLWITSDRQRGVSLGVSSRFLLGAGLGYAVVPEP